MRRFHEIRGVLVALTMALLLAACGGGSQPGAAGGGSAAPQQTYQWKLITTWPKNLPGLGTAPERFADMVEEMSAGRMKIRVYGADELVGAFEVFDAVSQGQAEMGHGAAYYWRGKVPEAALFTAVPFGLNAQEMNGWLYHRGGLELYQELYAQHNLVPFPGGNTGVQMAGWFNREINSLDDLSGLKMRIPGLGGEVFERAGGVAVSLPGREIYTSLQTGTIDATEWVGPYNDLAFGLHEIAEYYYYPGWQEPGPTLEFVVNMDHWNSLPEDLQAIVRVAARAANEDMLAEYTARNNAALVELVDKHGVKLRELPPDVLQRLREVSDEVVAEIAESSPMARRIYDSFAAFRRDVVPYHRITEQAYYNAREATAPKQ